MHGYVEYNAMTCSTTTKTHIYFFKCACMVSIAKVFFEQSRQQTFSGHSLPNSETPLNGVSLAGRSWPALNAYRVPRFVSTSSEGSFVTSTQSHQSTDRITVHSKYQNPMHCIPSQYSLGPPSACQQNAIQMAFRWQVDGGPQSYAYLVSICTCSVRCLFAKVVIR